MTPERREEVERKHFPDRFGICDICEASVRIAGHEHDPAKLEAYLTPPPPPPSPLRLKLLNDLALAFYTISYVEKHQSDWKTPQEEEAGTNPAYIKERFDAHVGTTSWLKYFRMAEKALEICEENSSHFVPILLADSE